LVGATKFIVWFEDVGKGDLALVGGKGANLGEMVNAGIPVPPGFIVTVEGYFHFLERADLRGEIERLLTPLDPNDSQLLQKVSAKIKEAILTAEMPQEIAQGIEDAYAKLGGFVAVRSSATAEDLAEASFAGQQRTFLNVEGEDEVVRAVQGCWASLFESRAIFYRSNQGLDHLSVGIAVPVQKMVQSEASGVLFTLEPVSYEDNVVIEAVYGLGEAVVSGEVTPDMYTVDKRDFTILDKVIVKQEKKLVRNPEKVGSIEVRDIWVPVPESEQEKQKLSDADILHLAKLGVQIEEHYKFPQDIEWAKEPGALYIVQTRPVTAIKRAEEVARAEELLEAQLLLTGSPASPGVGAGPVRIVLDPSQINEVKQGDVLVAKMTAPDYVPAMKRAAAIVTDLGGRTCHAAIVSRELGVPCIVGAGKATDILNNGQEITVDGSQGKVYAGILAPLLKAKEVSIGADIETRTKVYVNLADPELAEAVAARNVDGVGLLRAEFMIAQIGEHPSYMLAQGRGEEFTQKLAQGLTTFAKAFHPRPVVYRTTDFKTNEYRNLKGGEQYEEEEENPMLGYRGCSRYLKDIETFKLELEAIKRIREEYNNLWVMIPFVRTVEEMAGAKRVLEDNGLRQSEDFKLWMMAEVPSNVFLLDEFIDVGIDGISIGSNDLTQLVLGVDRDSPMFGEEFDERNEAVLIALERLITGGIKRGVTVSICGQAPSVYPELTAKLVEWGITSVSVSPDAIESTREIIAPVERRLAEVRDEAEG
jgi:pyruvate,water dikinase